jgi:hypothetical protein
MKIFGVDPGPKKSGWCYLDTTDGIKISFGHDWNGAVITRLLELSPAVLGYEWIQNYGGVVGEDVFRTCYMCGRLREAFKALYFHEPTRPQIIKHFTGRTNLPKPEVRRVLRSRFEGHNAELLRGITNHAWDALAVCIYLYEDVYGYDKTYWGINRLRDPF